ncbi:MAG TPA: hypothetical protein VGE07_00550 [Herpetosiphonaceae bacterium]
MSYHDHDDGDDVCGCGYWDCDCPGIDEEYARMREEIEAEQGPPPLPDSETQHILFAFAHAMGYELMANRDKGDWRVHELDGLIGPDGELAQHVAKLERAIADGNQPRVREHAVDVANIALMAMRAAGRRAMVPAAAAGDPLAELGAGPCRE